MCDVRANLDPADDVLWCGACVEGPDRPGGYLGVSWIMTLTEAMQLSQRLITEIAKANMRKAKKESVPA
jgi:hypothetical protein